MTSTGHEATARAIAERVKKREQSTRNDASAADREAMREMANKINAAHNRIERLERVIAALAIEAARGS